MKEPPKGELVRCRQMLVDKDLEMRTIKAKSKEIEASKTDDQAKIDELTAENTTLKEQLS